MDPSQQPFLGRWVHGFGLEFDCAPNALALDLDEGPVAGFVGLVQEETLGLSFGRALYSFEACPRPLSYHHDRFAPRVKSNDE